MKVWLVTVFTDDNIGTAKNPIYRQEHYVFTEKNTILASIRTTYEKIKEQIVLYDEGSYILVLNKESGELCMRITIKEVLNETVHF